jgi:sialic acid synthase SpsE
MFIAEISSNHDKDLHRCLAFVKSAKQAGFDAIKFQAFKINQLFAPEILSKSKMHSDREAWEFPLEFLPEITTACRNAGLQLGMTPFYLDAIEACAPYVDFFKIASYELTWPDLIAGCAATGKPLILSSGMASMDEVQAGIAVAKSAGAAQVEVLHCVSSYPADGGLLNLSAIETMREKLEVPIGWSDHSHLKEAIVAAVLRWGAKTVEMHFDIDGKGAEFGPGHCWLPDEAADAISMCKIALSMDGDGEKKPSSAELDERMWRADPSDGLRPFIAIRETFKT